MEKLPEAVGVGMPPGMHMSYTPRKEPQPTQDLLDFYRGLKSQQAQPTAHIKEIRNKSR